MGFLPKAGQAGEVLKALEINQRASRRRGEVVVIAKTFVDAFKLQGDVYKNVAYSRVDQAGVGPITGGTRVALDVMYGLYMRAPDGSITQCIDWVLDQTPEILAAKGDWDLGSAKDGRRVGEISPTAYQLAETYFMESMRHGNREQREAYRAQQRAGGYRRVSALTKSQREQLKEVKAGLGG